MRVAVCVDADALRERAAPLMKPLAYLLLRSHRARSGRELISRGVALRHNGESAMDVAVVITFYRDDAYFAQALASVLAQTRVPDQILVVDDASPDGEAESLRRLDPRVRVIRHKVNAGPAIARQTGTDASTASLVAYLDSDDIWLPEKIERQLAFLEAHQDLAASHTGLVTFRDDGFERVFSDKPRELSLAEALHVCHVLPSTLMIRRAALDAVGGWITDRRITEDWELTIRLVAAGRRIGFLAEPLVRVRRAGHGNLSSQAKRLMRGNLRMMNRHLGLYLRTLGVRGTINTFGEMIAGGGRLGGVDGRALRTLGWLLGHREG